MHPSFPSSPARIAALQPIKEFLVITEIESLLLQFPLQVPIGLGSEDEPAMLFLDGRNHINPVLRSGPLACLIRPRYGC